MDPSTYSGWKNYETWCVHLWLSNDEGSYEWARTTAATAFSEPREDWAPDCITDADRGRHRAADALKEALEEQAAESVPQGTLWADMANAALSEVDWAEVAEAFLELDEAKP